MEIHKAKYVHRNLNSSTILVSFSRRREKEVRVEIVGEEIVRDLYSDGSGGKDEGEEGDTVFRQNR